MTTAAGLLEPGGGVFAQFPELGAAIAALEHLDTAEPTDELRAATAWTAAALASLRNVRIGALRVPAPEGYGLTLPEFVDVVIALAAVAPDVPHALIQHFAAVEVALGESNTGLLESVGDGLHLGAAFTEGHDVALGASRTTVRPDEHGVLRLDGHKEYTTGALYADVITVLATDEHDRAVRVSIPVARTGVLVHDDWNGIGQQGSASGSISFSRVLVEPSEISPWVERTQHAPDLQQLLIVAILAGIAVGAARQATDLVRVRRRVYSIGSGTSARHDPLLQQTVGGYWAQAHSARSIVLQAASDIQTAATHISGVASADAAEALRVAADASVLHAQVSVVPIVLAQTSAIFDALGGSAVRADVGLERHWRNARTLASHNPVAYKSKQLGAYMLNDEPPEQVSVVRGFTGVLPAGPERTSRA